MELGKFIEKYNFIFDMDSKDDIYTDIKDLIIEQIQCIEHDISYLLSSINTICDSIISNEENEYRDSLYQYYHKLSFDINFISDSIIDRFTRSLDEIYHDSLYRYKDYNFPESFKEFIEKDKYIIEFERRYTNDK